MKQFQILAWFWLALGAVGAVYKCWHAVYLGGFIYFKSGIGGLAWEIGECVIAVGVAATGYGLVKGWRFSWLAAELIASILLGVSGTCLLFRGDIFASARMAIYLPPSLFALYSLVVVMFLRYEPQRA